MTARSIVSLLQGICAFVGACDAGFVYIEKMRAAALPCTVGGGCNDVTGGPYSHIGPIDLSLLGATAYVLILFLSIVKGTTEDDRIVWKVRWVGLALTTFGLLFSWYLQWEAMYVIKAFCIYCRISAITMTVLFALYVVDIFCLANRAADPIGDSQVKAVDI